VRSLDLDLGGACFARGDLPAVPSILREGDLLAWASLLADRELTLRRVPSEAGDRGWLAAAFKALGNERGLRFR
jgi:hypothetical protein